MGFLVEDESSALMWRGLMLSRGVQHFLQDVAWGADLDYLLVDMPPGTGDVQMGVAKLVPRAEVLVVTTPAVAAQKVASRVVSMSRKNFLRVAGVVENMSALHLRPRRRATSCSARAAAPRWPTRPASRCSAQIPIGPVGVAGGDSGEPGGARRQPRGRGVPHAGRGDPRRGDPTGPDGHVHRTPSHRRPDHLAQAAGNGRLTEIGFPCYQTEI